MKRGCLNLNYTPSRGGYRKNDFCDSLLLVRIAPLANFGAIALISL
jgi:hypothetical protein